MTSLDCTAAYWRGHELQLTDDCLTLQLVGNPTAYSSPKPQLIAMRFMRSFPIHGVILRNVAVHPYVRLYVRLSAPFGQISAVVLEG